MEKQWFAKPKLHVRVVSIPLFIVNLTRMTLKNDSLTGKISDRHSEVIRSNRIHSFFIK